MNDVDQLSSVLADFARTMATDFPIQAILDHLVEQIVAILPVTGAGVTLISRGKAPQYVAASDAAALRYERLQSELGQGPCLTAYESGDAVVVPDLAVDTQYPQFRPAALAAGMAAVFTFPMRHGDDRVGALDLYRDRTGGLDAADMAAAQTLADVAAAYLLNAQSRERASETLDRFRDSALRDALTGLPNRLLFQQRLEHAAERGQRSHSMAAVLFVDLDRFKQVNDTYGHAVGDALLIAVGARLTSLVRPGDTLARLSGDEFVFLCEDMAHEDDAELLAARIDRAFTHPFVVAGLELFITASVGIAYSGPGQAITNQLVANADAAMYEAKRKGGGAHKLIDLRALEHSGERDPLARDLHGALAGPHVDLAYQPIVRTADGVVVGVEALLRWTHPVKGPIPPLTAVSVAEQTGLIGAVGTWVLERSCRDRAIWLQETPDQPLDLSVNISSRQLMGPGFSATVARALDATGMDPAALILEVTEGIFLVDGERAMSVLADLKALGLRLALDDFGTGYCSLDYLRRFPMDTVKMHQGFAAELGRDPAGATIMAAVSNLAHALGLQVVAEGIETDEQHAVVAGMRCDRAQGYRYARPMSAAEVGELLRTSRGARLRLPQPV